jgi:hypothetical protein
MDMIDLLFKLSAVNKAAHTISPFKYPKTWIELP